MPNIVNLVKNPRFRRPDVPRMDMVLLLYYMDTASNVLLNSYFYTQRLEHASAFIEEDSSCSVWWLSYKLTTGKSTQKIPVEYLATN